MNRKITLSLTIASSVLSLSCAVIPERPMGKTDETWVATVSETCERKPYVHFSFLESTYSAFDTKNYRNDINERNRGGIPWSSKHIYDTLVKSNLFILSSPGDAATKYYIQFERINIDYSNAFQLGSFWLSNLTLGIIPGYGFGSLSVKATIRDNEGSLVSELSSSVVSYHYLHGLIFLPLDFFPRFTGREMHEKFLPVLTGEIIEKMKHQKLLNCTPP